MRRHAVRQGHAGEGPYTAIWLRMEGDKVVKASFDTYGCPAATATASWLTRWVEGKTVEQAAVITPGMLIQVLGGLPLAKEQTAYLAIKALQAALEELRERNAPLSETEGATRMSIGAGASLGGNLSLCGMSTCMFPLSDPAAPADACTGGWQLYRRQRQFQWKRRLEPTR